MSKKVAEQGNFMILGSTGSGKTFHCARVLEALLTKQQLNDWSELRKGIQKNNNSGEHHDNQK